MSTSRVLSASHEDEPVLPPPRLVAGAPAVPAEPA